jgi:hypothetical protein
MLSLMHYARTESKCLLHYIPRYPALMSGASDRLKQARERAGYTSAKSAAEAMGVVVATYIQHESGLRGFPASKAERYGRFFRVAPEWLLYGRQQKDAVHPASLGPSLFVKGEVAAGLWKEAWEFDPDEWEVFTGRADVTAPIKDRFGLRLTGRSMDEIYVRYWGDETIPSGKRVVVQRTRLNGQLETTVKELIRTPEGAVWLRPRSTDPSFLAFRGDEPDSPDIAAIEIIALVVGSYRPE